MSSSQNNRSKIPLLHVPRQAVQEFRENVTALWCQNNGVEILTGEPTALRFLRDFVALSRPCIIRNAVIDKENGRPFSLTLDELVERYPDLVLTVDATPDGHGDCLREVVARTPIITSTTSATDDDVTDIDADVTTESMFVKPQERTMTLSAFRQGLRLSQQHQDRPSLQKIRQRIFPMVDTKNDTEAPLNPERDETSIVQDQEPPVLYYSRQNDCLRQELGPLWESLTVHSQRLPTSFPWAEEAFGTTSVDAINLWMGNERAVSSMHKDHYENLFYVASGEKIFTLCPPADAPILYERPVPSGRFAMEDDNFKSHHDGEAHQPGVVWNVRADGENSTPELVPWITADVTRQDDTTLRHAFPLLQYAHPQTVRVQAGELLYLPALWFHRVTQSCETIGINYWYDMNFAGPSWSYFQFLQQLVPTTVASATTTTTTTDVCGNTNDDSFDSDDSANTAI